MIRLADIRAAVEAGPAVLVLVTEASGSTPREAGAAMLVTGAGLAGSIGGGAVEHRATEIARAMLAEDRDRCEEAFPLGPELDQCCGGRMRLAFARLGPGEGAKAAPGRLLRLQGEGPGRGSAGHEGSLELWPGGPVFFDPSPPRPVYVWGAGHVGRALVAALAPLPFRVTWVDARLGQMAGAPAGVDCIETPLPEAVAAEAPADAFHVVLTHSHALDLEIIAAILARPHGFCGLIGSATKREVFARRLAERGLSAAAIARLICPIGLDGLTDKRPAVIAAATVAQLLLEDAAAAAGAAPSASPAG